MPKVSIIIPAYNVDKYISRGIDSCINQTEKDIEVIIIDDGSKDDTLSILEGYKEKDNRIIVCTQSNSGVSVARNKALDLATGQYIIFLDSDDWLELDAVEKMITAITNEDIILLCCDAIFVTMDPTGNYIYNVQGKDKKEIEISQKEAFNHVVQSDCFHLKSSCYKLFKKSVIDEKHLRFPEGIHQGEDGVFVFNYLKYSERVKYIPFSLWNILERPGSACTSSYSKKWKTAITAIDMMLSWKDNSEKLKTLLKDYKVKRAIWIAIECIRSQNYNKVDVLFAKRIIRKDILCLFKTPNSFKTRFDALIISITPICVLKILLRMK